MPSSPRIAPWIAITLTLSTGLLTGLWPALRGSRGDPQNDLKESANSLVAGRQQVRSLNSLVVMEIALAMVLLTFAGLLAKSFTYLLHTNLGYRTDRLLTFRMPLPSSRYRTGQARVQFWDKLLPQLTALPGVASAAAADSVPLGGTYDGKSVEVEGQTGGRHWADVMFRDASVTPDYFRKARSASACAWKRGNGGESSASSPILDTRVPPSRPRPRFTLLSPRMRGWSSSRSARPFPRRECWARSAASSGDWTLACLLRRCGPCGSRSTWLPHCRGEGANSGCAWLSAPAAAMSRAR
jgi:hypothetical protein